MGFKEEKRDNLAALQVHLIQKVLDVPKYQLRNVCEKYPSGTDSKYENRLNFFRIQLPEACNDFCCLGCWDMAHCLGPPPVTKEAKTEHN